MSEEDKTLGTWEEVIVDFFEKKVAQSKLYKARDYISKKRKGNRIRKGFKKIGAS